MTSSFDMTTISASNIYIYDSVVVFSKICGPGPSLLSKMGPVSDMINKTMGMLEKFISDLSTAYYALIAAFIGAIIIGLIYMLFLRLFVGILVFITIIAIILG